MPTSLYLFFLELFSLELFEQKGTQCIVNVLQPNALHHKFPVDLLSCSVLSLCYNVRGRVGTYLHIQVGVRFKGMN